MDKKLQEVIDTLNSLGITEVNSRMLQRINEILIAQKQTKVEQIKILEFIQSKTSKITDG
jgi:hypothetical protein